MQPRSPVWEAVRNAPLGPGWPRPNSAREEIHAIRLMRETNEFMREIIEHKRRYQLTGVGGFIGPLPHPIGLLDESAREKRRVWALPSPFLDPLFGRDIVSPFPMSHRLQQSSVGTWEH